MAPPAEHHIAVEDARKRAYGAAPASGHGELPLPLHVCFSTPSWVLPLGAGRRRARIAVAMPSGRRGDDRCRGTPEASSISLPRRGDRPV